VLVASLSKRNDFFHVAWEEQGVIASEGGLELTSTRCAAR